MSAKGLSISTLRSHFPASFWTRCPVRLLFPEISDQAPRKLAATAGAMTSTASDATYLPPPDPDSKRTDRPWQLLGRAWEKIAAAFMFIATATLVLASPLAWAVWACTAYFAAAYVSWVIIWKSRFLSSPGLALIVVAMLAFSAFGTWELRDGIDQGKPKTPHSTRGVLAAISVLKRSIVDLTTKFQASASAAELQRSQSEGSATTAAAPSMTFKASVKMRLSGKHANASASMEVLPVRERSAKVARTKGISSSAGSSASSNGGVAGPAGASSTEPTGKGPATTTTTSDTPGPTPPGTTSTDPPGTTPVGSLGQTGGTPAPESEPESFPAGSVGGG